MVESVTTENTWRLTRDTEHVKTDLWHQAGSTDLEGIVAESGFSCCAALRGGPSVSQPGSARQSADRSDGDFAVSGKCISVKVGGTCQSVYPGPQDHWSLYRIDLQPVTWCRQSVGSTVLACRKRRQVEVCHYFFLLDFRALKISQPSVRADNSSMATDFTTLRLLLSICART